MGNESRGRRRVASESLSLTMADISSPYSQLRSTDNSIISPLPAQDIVVRGSRRKEPRHVPNGDERRPLRVYSDRKKTYTEINVSAVKDLDECWISEATVERLGLKRRPNLTGKTEYGCLGLQTFEFRGSVTLQWLCKNNSQPTRCRIVPSEIFQVYLPYSLLPPPSPLQRTPSAPSPLSKPSSSNANMNQPSVASVMNPSSEYTGQFDGGESEEVLETSKEAIRADKWIKEMEKVHNRNPDYVRDQTTKRIKIAVLDTGVDPTHLFIKGAMKKQLRIKARRSFVDGINDAHVAQDSHGHGTHVAALLLKVAPDAQLYIAKVASGGKIPANHNIADAIKWAAECEVDIITMSFGIDIHHPAMQKEINEAYNNNIIIFAAASNRGNNHPVPYPAWRSNEVLCIYATDGLGKPYDGNPAQLEDSAHHFATLGVAVKSAWLQPKGPPSNHSEEQRKTGTSFATPIAAGIAAYILEFARVNKMDEKSYQILRTRAGMEKIFTMHLVVNSEGLDYIHLWNLFAEHRTDQDIIFLIQDTLGLWIGKAGQQTNGELSN